MCTCRYGKVAPGRGVTSSSSKTRGRVRMARAMATRCFCPPLRRTPRSPTAVWYDWGNAEMKSCAFAKRAASSTWAQGCIPNVRDSLPGGISVLVLDELLGQIPIFVCNNPTMIVPGEVHECISSARDVYLQELCWLCISQPHQVVNPRAPLHRLRTPCRLIIISLTTRFPTYVGTPGSSVASFNPHSVL
jgi:hypothetical protein